MVDLPLRGVRLVLVRLQPAIYFRDGLFNLSQFLSQFPKTKFHLAFQLVDPANQFLAKLFHLVLQGAITLGDPPDIPLHGLHQDKEALDLARLS